MLTRHISPACVSRGADVRHERRPCRGCEAEGAPSRASVPVRGIYNWIHSTGDAERAFAFYHDVFGIELARSPFARRAGQRAAGAIRPASQAGSDPLVWDLTNTHGSRFRTVFMRAANTPFGLELSEFFDIPRGERRAEPVGSGRVDARSSPSATSTPSSAG